MDLESSGRVGTLRRIVASWRQGSPLPVGAHTQSHCAGGGIQIQARETPIFGTGKTPDDLRGRSVSTRPYSAGHRRFSPDRSHPSGPAGEVFGLRPAYRRKGREEPVRRRHEWMQAHASAGRCMKRSAFPFAFPGEAEGSCAQGDFGYRQPGGCRFVGLSRISFVPAPQDNPISSTRCPTRNPFYGADGPARPDARSVAAPAQWPLTCQQGGTARIEVLERKR